jgi:hypothetical protein
MLTLLDLTVHLVVVIPSYVITVLQSEQTPAGFVTANQECSVFLTDINCLFLVMNKAPLAIAIIILLRIPFRTGASGFWSADQTCRWQCRGESALEKVFR